MIARLLTNYQTRNYFAGSVVIIIMVAGYIFAIRPTIQEVSTNKELNRNISGVNINGVSISKLEQELQLYEGMIYQGTEVGFQNELLAQISQVTDSKKTRLVDFVLLQVESDGILEQSIFGVELSGRYTNLIETAESLSKNLVGGSILSTHFEMVRDPRTRRNNLQCKLYIQSVSYEK